MSLAGPNFDYKPVHGETCKWLYHCTSQAVAYRISFCMGLTAVCDRCQKLPIYAPTAAEIAAEERACRAEEAYDARREDQLLGDRT